MSTFLAHITGFFKKVGHFIVNLYKVSKYALFNKVKYKTIDECINGYAFDFGYLYNLELAKLREMVEYFTKHGISEDNDKYIKQMKLAIKLLEIVNEEGGYHFEHYPEEHGKIIFENYIDESGKMVSVSNMKYVCDVNVNIKNADRFVNNKYEKEFYVNKFPHELYLLKAKHLYHKLRNDFEQTWWD